MSSPYDHEALWLKAKMFINRSMDGDGRQFDEQALWASLALEILAKASLARTSPLLIACGLVEGHARFTSVRAKTLYKRCSRAFRPFSDTEAERITAARNEYLHGSSPTFTSIPANAWWPRFWAQATILVGALDREIEDLIGPSRVDEVEKHLAQNVKNVEHRTQALIERAVQRLAQHESGTLPVKVASEWKPGFDRSLGLPHRDAATCPACGEQGVLEGENVAVTEVEWNRVDWDDYEMTVTLNVDADYFSCPTCQLVLDGYELLEQAGLDTSFYSEGDENDYALEPEYGNE